MKSNKMFEQTVEKFKELYIILLKSKTSNTDLESKLKLLNLGIHCDSGYEWMLELINFNKYIINYFDTINKDYCKKYHIERIEYPDKPTKLPDIYQDFKLYTTYLIEEKYENLENIRTIILNKYNI